MNFTKADLDQLFASPAQEGQSLEFKAGAALARDSDARRELVKDCTGFANASGGRIVYGVAEAEIDGVWVASGLAPVTDAVVGADWISEILRSNTGPPLTRCDVVELAVDGGRVVVVDIEQASTAHQNLIDKKYYQRGGRVTSAMVDFQIRDVMGRRTRPQVEVKLKLRPEEVSSDYHRHYFGVEVVNVGAVSLEHWALTFDIPEMVIADQSGGSINSDPDLRGMLSGDVGVNYRGIRMRRLSLGDPATTGRRWIIHPGQSVVFHDRNATLPYVPIEMTHARHLDLQPRQVPISWRMYVKDAPPLEGQFPFSEWCKF